MSRRYMLDTDNSSFVIRGTNTKLNRKVASKAGSLCMSAITYHELLYGAQMRDSKRLESVIEMLVEMVPVVEFSAEAQSRGQWYWKTSTKKGKPIYDWEILGNESSD